MTICWHEWSYWSDPIDTMGDNVKVQARCCVKCNKYQVKKISQPWNIWFRAENIVARREQ